MKRTTNALKFSVTTRFLLACGLIESRSPDTSATGLHVYDLRDEDSTGEICELKSHVMVNHWGTVILKEKIDGADEGIDLDGNDYNYLDENMTLDEFANPAPTMEQTM